MLTMSPEVTGRLLPSSGRAPPDDLGDVSTPLALRLGSQRADGQILALVMLERIEAEEAHRVAVRDLVDLRVGQMLDRLPQTFRHFRPQRIRMRVVAFIGDVVLADRIQMFFRPNASSMKQVRKCRLNTSLGLTCPEARVGPGLVPPVGEVGALHEVGNPADAAFGQGDPQVRIACSASSCSQSAAPTAIDIGMVVIHASIGVSIDACGAGLPPPMCRQIVMS